MKSLIIYCDQGVATDVKGANVSGSAVASFQQNLGGGVDPTGDRSYPPWNHPPYIQEILHRQLSVVDSI